MVRADSSGDLQGDERDGSFDRAGTLRFALGERLLSSPRPARRGEERNGWCPEVMYTGRLRDARVQLHDGRPAAALAGVLPYLATPLDEGLHYTVADGGEIVVHLPGEALRLAQRAADDLHEGGSRSSAHPVDLVTSALSRAGTRFAQIVTNRDTYGRAVAEALSRDASWPDAVTATDRRIAEIPGGFAITVRITAVEAARWGEPSAVASALQTLARQGPAAPPAEAMRTAPTNTTLLGHDPELHPTPDIEPAVKRTEVATHPRLTGPIPTVADAAKHLAQIARHSRI